MLIGLDFDNTIVCYNQAITLLAEKLFDLPKGMPRTKLALRDFLRSTGRETEWTAFQGEIYGPGMRFAQPFEGAISTMRQLADQGNELVIISHRSKKPYAGTPYDLHASAKNWINNHLKPAGLFRSKSEINNVQFYETRGEKLRAICEINCDLFLDDLPEVLASKGFPSRTLGILFDPSKPPSYYKDRRSHAISSWNELSDIALNQ